MLNGKDARRLAGVLEEALSTVFRGPVQVRAAGDRGHLAPSAGARERTLLPGPGPASGYPATCDSDVKVSTGPTDTRR